MDRNSFLIGESLVGDGNEVAHIDLVIGHKAGPAGAAFVQRLNTQTSGHNALLAVLAPNVPAKPDTVTGRSIRSSPALKPSKVS